MTMKGSEMWADTESFYRCWINDVLESGVLAIGIGRFDYMSYTFAMSFMINLAISIEWALGVAMVTAPF